jgi:hypothetical protein
VVAPCDHGFTRSLAAKEPTPCSPGIRFHELHRIFIVAPVGLSHAFGFLSVDRKENTMLKNFMVIVGGAALAVSLPFVALAATTDDVASTDIAPVTTDEMAAVDQFEAGDPVLGPIRELEQIQIQDPVIVQDEVLTQDQVLVRQQLRIHAETGPPEGFEPIQERLHQGERLGLGNPDAPMAGAGTGECLYDGEPLGTGTHGPTSATDG